MRQFTSAPRSFDAVSPIATLRPRFAHKVPCAVSGIALGLSNTVWPVPAHVPLKHLQGRKRAAVHCALIQASGRSPWPFWGERCCIFGFLTV